MEERNLTYFVADVHLGSNPASAAEKEARFVSFLRSIPPQRTSALYMLGDIWDFWYEYRDVVPKGSARVFAALQDLMDAGVKVNFIRGNHDVWTYHYLQDMGINVMNQVQEVTLGDAVFCIGHGDGLGPGMRKYNAMRSLFYNRVAQVLFSTLHPWFAYRIGRSWSASRQKKHVAPYKWSGEDESLYKFACGYEKEHKVDYFVFGHYHSQVDMKTPGGARFIVLKDWKEESPYLYFDGKSLCSGHSRNME
ncbi:MAG: UDP-2,3-diacylglucosamine diphosphatase [Bacteroidales bacterium]|nr:UDP-2,3-diacylglucosamine diphosphatase [Bacteroidales bacterium]